MAESCDFGLMVWDLPSTGTLRIVYELPVHGKKAWVFVNKVKEFRAVQK